MNIPITRDSPADWSRMGPAEAAGVSTKAALCWIV